MAQEEEEEVEKEAVILEKEVVVPEKLETHNRRKLRVAVA